MNDNRNAQVSLGLEVIHAISSMTYRVSAEHIAEIMIRLYRYNSLLPVAPETNASAPSTSTAPSAQQLDQPSAQQLDQPSAPSQPQPAKDGYRNVTLGWLDENRLGWYNARVQRADLPRAYVWFYYPAQTEQDTPVDEIFEVAAISRQRDGRYVVWFYNEESEIESQIETADEILLIEDK